MPKTKKTINEDLSKNLKQTLRKAAERMSEELGISLDEASYATGVYGELKDKNLFKASYIRDIELEADPGEKIPDITNLQQMVNYPKLMYKIVTLVLFDTPEFMEKYDILYSSEDKGVRLKKKKKKKNELKNKLSTPWDKYKVAEDNNWITFQVLNYDSSIKMYYQKVFNDPRMKANGYESFYTSSWCILSNRGNFTGQRGGSNNTWNFTFSKVNPVDRIIAHIKKMNMDQDTKDKLIDMIDNPKEGVNLGSELARIMSSSNRAYDDSLAHELRNTYLGEVFLMHKDKERFSGYGEGNYGHHLYTNRPNGSVDSSYLSPKPRYSYFSFTDISEPFSISGGQLTSYNEDDDVVKIPEGVSSIESGAFQNKTVSTLILPKTLTTIKANAFINCDLLSQIRATNAIAYISKKAFDDATIREPILFGVFEEVKGKLVVKKPFNLEHYPKEAFKLPGGKDKPSEPEEQPSNDDTDPELLNDVEDLVEESKNIVKEDIRIKNKALYDYENEYIIIEHGVMEFRDNVSGKKFGDVIIPEGVKRLRGKIKGSYDSLVFPKSFKGWDETISGVIETRAKVEILDFSQTSGIRIVGDKAFYFSRIKELILPDTILGIGKYAFMACSIKKIYIPSSVEEIDSKAFNNTGFLETIVTDNPEVLAQKLEEAQVSLRNAPDIVARGN